MLSKMEPLLSVLDLTPWPAGTAGAQAVRNTVDLARHADGLGFHRYWLSEHHNLPSIISPTPEVLLAAVGAATRRIRIGSGGVMLPNHSPLRIAEAFRVLESLYPGRVDLGLGRAPGSDGRAALALRRTRERMQGDDFPELLDELLAYGGRGEFPPEHPFRTLRALPDDVALPPVWILGSSDYGARLAGRRGMGYGFAHHFSAQWVDAAAQAYHANFRPSAETPRPHLILTVAAVCAETDAAADHLATTIDLAWVRRARGEFRPLPSPEEAAAHPWTPGERESVEANRENLFVGSPATVRAGILRLAARTQAAEVMVTTMTWDHTARRHSYELLAEAWGLGAVTELRQAA